MYKHIYILSQWLMIEKWTFEFELSAFYSWACHMIAYTLNGWLLYRVQT